MIEQGKFTKKFEFFSPTDTFSLILKMFAPQAKMMNCSLKFSCYKSLPTINNLPLIRTSKQVEVKLPSILYGDNIRLKQLLINFTKNALKFTFKGEIKIKATYDIESQLLIVHVEDTGKGISTADQELLFKAFGKIERHDQINREGVGMGLVICKNIIANSGGTIGLFSKGEN